MVRRFKGNVKDIQFDYSLSTENPYHYAYVKFTIDGERDTIQSEYCDNNNSAGQTLIAKVLADPRYERLTVGQTGDGSGSGDGSETVRG
jgi:hypothetical protein